MRVLIDIGNSRLKWQFHNEQGETLVQGNESLVNVSFHDCFGRWLKYGLKRNQGMIFYASVAQEEVNASLQDAALTHGISWHRFFSQPSWQDLTNSYQQPSQLGVDRWLAMVAVRNYYQGAACVIDCGSATTADYIAATGLHEGGLIMPGQYLMQQSLLQKTAKIALSSEIGASSVTDGEPRLGQDTDSAVNQGVRQMHEANVLRLINAALQQGRQVFLTGGGSQNIAQVYGVRYLPELVLEGVALLAQEFACPLQ